MLNLKHILFARKRFNGQSLKTLAGAALLLAQTGFVLADMQDPTITGNTTNYTLDPESEIIYSLITGSEAWNGGPTIGTEGLSDADQVLYVCGTNACIDDPGFDIGDVEDRSAALNNLGGYAVVQITEYGPAGSGYDQDGDVFLRLQHNEQTGNGYRDYETAYNTDVVGNPDLDLQGLSDGGYEYENMAKDTGAGGGPDFNHAILYSEDLLSDEGNLQFLLDIDEANSSNGSMLLVDELSFFVSLSPVLNLYQASCDVSDAGYAGPAVSNTSTDAAAGCFQDQAAVKVWDMDLDAIIAAIMLDNSNGSGQAGSGDYDAMFTLDAGLFTSAAELLGWSEESDTDFYIYLETTMGRSDYCYRKNGKTICPAPSSGEADAGFEEWKMAAFTEDTPEVPVPATLALFGLGLIVLARSKARS